MVYVWLICTLHVNPSLLFCGSKWSLWNSRFLLLACLAVCPVRIGSNAHPRRWQLRHPLSCIIEICYNLSSIICKMEYMARGSPYSYPQHALHVGVPDLEKIFADLFWFVLHMNPFESLEVSGALLYIGLDLNSGPFHVPTVAPFVNIIGVTHRKKQVQ